MNNFLIIFRMIQSYHQLQDYFKLNIAKFWWYTACSHQAMRWDNTMLFIAMVDHSWCNVLSFNLTTTNRIKIRTFQSSIYRLTLQLNMTLNFAWRQSGLGVRVLELLIWRSWVQVLHPATHWICRLRFNSSAAVCKQPTGLPPARRDFQALYV